MRVLAPLLLAVLFASPAAMADRTYEDLIRPALRARCAACHGALEQKAGLRLDTAAAILAGGRHGVIVDLTQPERSTLLDRLRSEDPTHRMPPEGAPMDARVILALEAWIADGTPAPTDEQPEADPAQHWAFLSPREDGAASELAEALDREGATALDAALADLHRERGLRAQPPADSSTLLRRLYLDLIGLPPTLEQQRAFLADPSPASWTRQVDQLLASPQHAERWARHWMDVWRYSDWYGLDQQLRHSQKHLWHWRDWIVESLQEDLGYDRMLSLMLAADELAPTDADALRATGYLARSYYLFNRDTWLDDTLEHFGQAFLGLTVQCARCHDHKYDPISQRDYYSLRAFFEPHQVRLDPVPGELDLEQDGLPRVFDAHLDAPTHLYVRGDAAKADRSEVLEPAVPGLLALDALDIQPVPLPLEAHRPGLRPHVLQDRLAVAEGEIVAARQALEAARAAQAAWARAVSLAGPVDAAPPLEGEDEGDAPPLLDQDFRQQARDGAASVDLRVWEPGPGAWSLSPEGLRQDEVGAVSRWLRTREALPSDFEATLRWRTLGGERWKSVGLSFDVGPEGRRTVYLSAVQPGSKLQVAHEDGGQTVYPPEAKLDLPVAPNREYELRVAVRGPLLNVWLDGRLALRHVLPAPRRPGPLELMAFDAVAEFRSVRARALSPDARLLLPGEPASPEQAEAALARAEAELERAQAKALALRSAFAADRAVALEPDPEVRAALVQQAARDAREVELAEARCALAAADAALVEGALAGAVSPDPTQQAAREEARDAARARFEEARARLADPGVEYPSPRAGRKAAEGPDETEQSRSAPAPDTSTGRRRALAAWLVDSRHPLTARVAVNHVWMHHFGTPLVDPLNDLGRRTPAPPLQVLLDALAIDLMDHGWSLRRLHRLIVGSEAYRRSSSVRDAEPATVAADPEAQWLWRRQPQRLEAEALRDGLLHLAGALDLRLGGPTVDPRLGDEARRRSLYFTQSRDDQHAFLQLFDPANHLACYRRSRTVVPQQALGMLNGALPLEMAGRIAARLPVGDDPVFVHEAFRIVLGRDPTGAEQDECVRGLAQLRRLLAERAHPQPEARARTDLVHALINHHDFGTIR